MVLLVCCTDTGFGRESLIEGRMNARVQVIDNVRSVLYTLCGECLISAYEDGRIVSNDADLR